MYTYLAYGLGIHSEIRIPELLRQENVPQDVVIRMERVASWSNLTYADGTADTLRGRESFDGPCTLAVPGEMHFSWSNIAAFRVRKGCRIDVQPGPVVDPALIRLPLLGVVFGGLLQQRGLTVLHASSVLVPGGAVAIVGPKGFGKSTLAGAMFRLGHEVLGDDVAAIERGRAGDPVIHAAFPYLNVWPHAAKSLGDNPDELPTLRTGGIKRALSVGRSFHAGAAPLLAIYLLEFGSRLETIPVPPREAFVRLLPHTYAARYLTSMKSTPSELLASCGELARRVPIRRLVRRDAVRDVFSAAHRLTSDAEQLSMTPVMHAAS